MALTVLAMCSAPPSIKSSLHTEVITTYFKPHSLIAVATLKGSSASRGLNLPFRTEQNLHLREQLFPMIMMVAVPDSQHSAKFGQRASSHTVCNSKVRREFLKLKNRFSEGNNFVLIHSGLLIRCSATVPPPLDRMILSIIFHCIAESNIVL